MKLGIAVVYLVLPGDKRLLDLHLSYVEQCTRVPFTIYAAATRLPEHLVKHLDTKPFVRLCAMPPTSDRGSLENAYYLEQLIAEAIAEGCTHVATLHVDSFPIRIEWAAQLEREIASGYAFAAAVREEDRRGKPTTAGLLFPREFYTRYRPKLLLTPNDMRSRAGRGYVRELQVPGESGTGYGYVAFREGLRWLRLRRTNRTEDHYYFGSIHGDTIFHLGAAAHSGRSFPGAREHPVLRSTIRTASARLPRSARRLLRFLIPSRILLSATLADQRAHNRVKEALLENPTLYIDRLRAATNESPWSITLDADAPESAEI